MLISWILGKTCEHNGLIIFLILDVYSVRGYDTWVINWSVEVLELVQIHSIALKFIKISLVLILIEILRCSHHRVMHWTFFLRHWFLFGVVNFWLNIESSFVLLFFFHGGTFRLFFSLYRDSIALLLHFLSISHLFNHSLYLILAQKLLQIRTKYSPSGFCIEFNFAIFRFCLG